MDASAENAIEQLAGWRTAGWLMSRWSAAAFALGQRIERCRDLEQFGSAIDQI
jgi:hypothetical protein